MALRHLLPSALLPSWDRETLSYSSQPHHPACSQSLQGPLQSPRAKEKLPLACTQAPLHLLQDHELCLSLATTQESFLLV